MKETLLGTHQATSRVLCPALGIMDKKDVNRLEQAQQRAIRMVRTLGQGPTKAQKGATEMPLASFSPWQEEERHKFNWGTFPLDAEKYF